MAAPRLPILSVARSLDDLPPHVAPSRDPDSFRAQLAEIAATDPFLRAAHRFARTPGPAEQAAALDRPSTLVRQLNERRAAREV